MLWAIASSVFVIYLYRRLNAASVSSSETVSADTVEGELAALNDQIAALERKLGISGVSQVGAKP